MRKLIEIRQVGFDQFFKTNNRTIGRLVYKHRVEGASDGVPWVDLATGEIYIAGKFTEVEVIDNPIRLS